MRKENTIGRGTFEVDTKEIVGRIAGVHNDCRKRPLPKPCLHHHPRHTKATIESVRRMCRVFPSLLRELLLTNDSLPRGPADSRKQNTEPGKVVRGTDARSARRQGSQVTDLHHSTAVTRAISRTAHQTLASLTINRNQFALPDT